MAGERGRVPARALADGTDAWPNDAALAAALVAGQPGASAAAWNRYAPTVFGLVSRAMGSDGDAEDITQEVFYRVFARVGTLRNPEALRSFVVSVAIRIVKWELRRRRVRRFVTLSETGELPETAGGFLSADQRYALRRFYQMLDRITARERLVLVLKHLEGMTLDEIAAAMDLSAATVKRALSRGTQQISAMVGDDPVVSRFVQRLGGGE